MSSDNSVNSKTEELRDKLVEAAINYVKHVSDHIGFNFSLSGTELTKAVKQYNEAKVLYKQQR